MSSDGTQLWGSGNVTQGLGTDQVSSDLPSYDTGQTYEQGASGNYQTIFGRAIPNPYGTAPNNMCSPHEPTGHRFTWNNNILDASVQASLPGANEPSTEVTSMPVLNGSTINVAPTSVCDRRAQSYSWLNNFPQNVNAIQTQPQTVEPNTFNHPQNVPSGAPRQTQIHPPMIAPSPGCPRATGLEFVEWRSDPGVFVPQHPRPIEFTQFPQTRDSGDSLISIQHPNPAFMQAQLRPNPLYIGTAAYAPGITGVNPHTRGWSSTGTSLAFSSARDRAAAAFSRPSYLNSPIPSGSPGVPYYRSRRSRNRHGPAQRFDSAGGSSSNHVSRQAIPKGLDDPLDKRPEPKETAEMTLNMECKVCMSQTVDTAVFPCGHAMFCRWCAEKCMPSHRHDKSRVKDSSRCPVCRSVVRQKMRIFLP